MIDWANLGKQNEDQYLNKYWGNAMTRYSNMGGRIVWDQNTGNAAYTASSNALPSLTRMWGDYSRGARSRGIKPDYFTFKKYYDQLKMTKNQQLVGALRNAQMQGIPMDAIHKAVRGHAGLRDDLINAVNTAGSPEMQAAYSEFIPPRELTTGEIYQKNKALLGGAGLAAMAGIGYGMGRNEAGLKAAEDILKDYRKKKPLKADYQTKTGKWIKGRQGDYNKDIKNWRATMKENIAGQRTASQSRFAKLLNRGKGAGIMKGGPGSIIAPTMALGFAHPMIKSMAKGAGLSDSEANKVANVTQFGGAVGYTTHVWNQARKALGKSKFQWKNLGKIIGKGPGWMKVMGAAIALLTSFGTGAIGGGSTQSQPTQAAPTRRDTPYNPII
jgi:hypothetical protein